MMDTNKKRRNVFESIRNLRNLNSNGESNFGDLQHKIDELDYRINNLKARKIEQENTTSQQKEQTQVSQPVVYQPANINFKPKVGDDIDKAIINEGAYFTDSTNERGVKTTKFNGYDVVELDTLTQQYGDKIPSFIDPKKAKAAKMYKRVNDSYQEDLEKENEKEMDHLRKSYDRNKLWWFSDIANTLRAARFSKNLVENKASNANIIALKKNIEDIENFKKGVEVEQDRKRIDDIVNTLDENEYYRKIYQLLLIRSNGGENNTPPSGRSKTKGFSENEKQILDNYFFKKLNEDSNIEILKTKAHEAYKNLLNEKLGNVKYKTYNLNDPEEYEKAKSEAEHKMISREGYFSTGFIKNYKVEISGPEEFYEFYNKNKKRLEQRVKDNLKEIEDEKRSISDNFKDMEDARNSMSYGYRSLHDNRHKLPSTEIDFTNPNFGDQMGTSFANNGVTLIKTASDITIGVASTAAAAPTGGLSYVIGGALYGVSSLILDPIIRRNESLAEASEVYEARLKSVLLKNYGIDEFNITKEAFKEITGKTPEQVGLSENPLREEMMIYLLSGDSVFANNKVNRDIKETLDKTHNAARAVYDKNMGLQGLDMLESIATNVIPGSVLGKTIVKSSKALSNVFGKSAAKVLNETISGAGEQAGKSFLREGSEKSLQQAVDFYSMGRMKQLANAGKNLMKETGDGIKSIAKGLKQPIKTIRSNSETGDIADGLMNIGLKTVNNAKKVADNPWVKILGSRYLSSKMEAAEEGYQYMIQENAKKGEYDNYQSHLVDWYKNGNGFFDQALAGMFQMSQTFGNWDYVKRYVGDQQKVYGTLYPWLPFTKEDPTLKTSKEFWESAESGFWMSMLNPMSAGFSALALAGDVHSKWIDHKRNRMQAHSDMELQNYFMNSTNPTLTEEQAATVGEIELSEKKNMDLTKTLVNRFSNGTYSIESVIESANAMIEDIQSRSDSESFENTINNIKGYVERAKAISNISNSKDVRTFLKKNKWKKGSVEHGAVTEYVYKHLTNIKKSLEEERNYFEEKNALADKTVSISENPINDFTIDGEKQNISENRLSELKSIFTNMVKQAFTKKTLDSYGGVLEDDGEGFQNIKGLIEKLSEIEDTNINIKVNKLFNSILLDNNIDVNSLTDEKKKEIFENFLENVIKKPENFFSISEEHSKSFADSNAKHIASMMSNLRHNMIYKKNKKDNYKSIVEEHKKAMNREAKELEEEIKNLQSSDEEDLKDKSNEGETLSDNLTNDGNNGNKNTNLPIIPFNPITEVDDNGTELKPFEENDDDGSNTNGNSSNSSNNPTDPTNPNNNISNTSKNSISDSNTSDNNASNTPGNTNKSNKQNNKNNKPKTNEDALNELNGKEPTIITTSKNVPVVLGSDPESLVADGHLITLTEVSDNPIDGVPPVERENDPIDDAPLNNPTSASNLAKAAGYDQNKLKGNSNDNQLLEQEEKIRKNFHKKETAKIIAKHLYESEFKGKELTDNQIIDSILKYFQKIEATDIDNQVLTNVLRSLANIYHEKNVKGLEKIVKEIKNKKSTKEAIQETIEDYYKSIDNTQQDLQEQQNPIQPQPNQQNNTDGNKKLKPQTKVTVDEISDHDKAKLNEYIFNWFSGSWYGKFFRKGIISYDKFYPSSKYLRKFFEEFGINPNYEDFDKLLQSEDFDINHLRSFYMMKPFVNDGKITGYQRFKVIVYSKDKQNVQKFAFPIGDIDTLLRRLINKKILNELTDSQGNKITKEALESYVTLKYNEIVENLDNQFINAVKSIFGKNFDIKQIDENPEYYLGGYFKSEYLLEFESNRLTKTIVSNLQSGNNSILDLKIVFDIDLTDLNNPVTVVPFHEQTGKNKIKIVYNTPSDNKTVAEDVNSNALNVFESMNIPNTIQGSIFIEVFGNEFVSLLPVKTNSLTEDQMNTFIEQLYSIIVDEVASFDKTSADYVNSKHGKLFNMLFRRTQHNTSVSSAVTNHFGVVPGKDANGNYTVDFKIGKDVVTVLTDSTDPNYINNANAIKIKLKQYLTNNDNFLQFLAKVNLSNDNGKAKLKDIIGYKTLNNPIDLGFIKITDSDLNKPYLNWLIENDLIRTNYSEASVIRTIDTGTSVKNSSKSLFGNNGQVSDNILLEALNGGAKPTSTKDQVNKETKPSNKSKENKKEVKDKSNKKPKTPKKPKKNEKGNSVTPTVSEEEVKQAAETIEDIKQETKSFITDRESKQGETDLNEIDAAGLLKSTNKTGELINIELELLELKKILGDNFVENSVSVISDVIRLINNGKTAFGMATKDAIILSRLAEPGTAYHEAYHRISRLILSPKQRDRIYKAYAKHYGVDINNVLDIEEGLADGFQDFYLNNRAEEYRNTELRNWYTRLKNLIKRLLNIKDARISHLYYQISQGKFANLPVNKQSEIEFAKLFDSELYKIGNSKTVFNSIQSASEVSAISSALLRLLLISSKIETFDNRYGINIDYNKIKGLVNSLVTSPKHIEELGEKSINLLKDVISTEDNFEYFKEKLSERLAKLKIDLRSNEEKEKSGTTTDEDNDENDEIEAENKREFWDVSSNEIKIEEHLPTYIKLFLSTLPETEFVTNPKTGQLELVNKKNSITNLSENADLTSTIHKLVSVLHKARSIEDMEKLIVDNSKTIPVFSALLRQINFYKQSVWNNDKEAIRNFWIKMWNSFHLSANNYAIVNIDKNGNATIIEQGVSENLKRKTEEWGLRFVLNNTTVNEIGKNVFNTEKNSTYNNTIVKLFSNFFTPSKNKKGENTFTHNSNYYENLAKLKNKEDQIKQIKDDIYSLLTNIGINLSRDEFESYIESKLKDVADDKLSKLYSLFLGSDTKNKYTNLNNIYSDLYSLSGDATTIVKSKRDGGTYNLSFQDVIKNNDLVKDLAAYVNKFNGDEVSFSSKKVTGGTTYTHVLHTALTQRVQDLMENFTPGNWDNSGRSLGVRDMLSSVPLNKSSIILQSLNKGGSLRLLSYNGMSFADVNKKNKEYGDQTLLEDYLMDIILASNSLDSDNGKILFRTPQLSDRQSTSFMEIFLPVKDAQHDYTKLNANNLYEKGFNPIIVNVFGDYLLSEIDAIKQAIMFMRSKDPKDFIDNVHKGKLNGLKFREFGTYVDKNINTEIKNLNKSASKDYNLDEILWSNVSEKDLSSSDKEVRENALNQLEHNLNWLKGFYFTESPTEGSKPNDRVKELVTDTIVTLVKEEIKTALKIGLIVKAENGSLINNLIPANIFDKLQGVTDDTKIKNLLAMTTINKIVGINEFNKAFVGDPAFFKDKSDWSKRLSLLLSSKQIPSVVENDSMFDIDSTLNATYTVAEMEESMVNSPFHGTLIEKMTPYFNDIIKRTLINKHSKDKVDVETLDINSEEYQKEYGKKHQEMFDRLVKERLGGFSTEDGKNQINEGDGGAYISPTMFKRLWAMDKGWSSQDEKAFQLLTDPNTEWTPENIAIASNLIFHPLKYNSWDIGFETVDDGNNGVTIQEKIKVNKPALFTVWPAFATGDMSAMLDIMNKKGIDMVKFSSAIKGGAQGKFKLYSDKNNTKLIDTNDQAKLNEIPTYKERLHMLGKQLATDSHGAKNKFLTQVRKLSLSNIDVNKVYDDIWVDLDKDGNPIPMTGQQIYDEVVRLHNHLFNLGLEKFKDKFSTPQKLSKELIKIAKDAGMSIDDLEAFQLINEDGTPYDPNNSTGTPKLKLNTALLAEQTWIERRIISAMGRDVIDIEVPGDTMVQMSSFGLKNTNKDLTEEERDKLINRGEPLKLFNEKTNAYESVISIVFFKDILKEAGKWENTSYEEKRQYLIDNNIIGKGDGVQAAQLAYRIPTQGQSSIAAVHVVDVYPEQSGYVITMPQEWTLLSGSDFDIDKLYIFRKSYHIDKNTGDVVEPKWKANVGLVDQNEAAVKNRLLDLYMKLNLSQMLVHDTKNPLDNPVTALKEDIVKDIDKVKGKKGKLNVPFSEYTISSDYGRKKNFLDGKNVLAVFALNNSNHVLTQMADIYFKDLYGNNQRILSETLSGIDSKDGWKILDILNALVSASVDVAKDPYITRLGINPFTQTMSSYLVRTGKGMGSFYFLRQDVIEELSEAFVLSKSTYGYHEHFNKKREEILAKYKQNVTNSGTKLHSNLGKLSIIDEISETEGGEELLKVLFGSSKDVILNFYNNFKEKTKGDQQYSYNYFDSLRNSFFNYDSKSNKPTILRDIMKLSLFDKDVLNSLKDSEFYDKLEKAIDGIEALNDLAYYESQVAIAEEYQLYETNATAMSDLVSATQIDTKKYGRTLSEIIAYILKADALLQKDNNIANAKDIFNKTMLGTAFNNTLLSYFSITNKYFNHSSEVYISNLIDLLRLTGNYTKYTQAEHIEKVLNLYDKAIVGPALTKSINEALGETVIDVENIESLYTGQNSLANQLNELKKKMNNGDIKENPLLKALDGEITGRYHIIRNKSFMSGTLTNKEDLVSGFYDLLKSDKKELRVFGHKLLYYAYNTGYGINGRRALYDLVPKDYLVDLNVSDNIHLNKDSLFDLFHALWTDDKLVPVVKLKPDNKDVLTVSHQDIKNAPPLRFAIQGQTAFKSHGISVPKRYVKMNINNNLYVYEAIYLKYNHNTKETKVIYELREKVGASSNGFFISDLNLVDDKIHYTKEGVETSITIAEYKKIFDEHMDKSFVTGSEFIRNLEDGTYSLENHYNGEYYDYSGRSILEMIYSNDDIVSGQTLGQRLFNNKKSKITVSSNNPVTITYDSKSITFNSILHAYLYDTVHKLQVEGRSLISYKNRLNEIANLEKPSDVLNYIYDEKNIRLFMHKLKGNNDNLRDRINVFKDIINKVIDSGNSEFLEGLFLANYGDIDQAIDNRAFYAEAYFTALHEVKSERKDRYVKNNVRDERRSEPRDYNLNLQVFEGIDTETLSDSINKYLFTLDNDNMSTLFNSLFVDDTLHYIENSDKKDILSHLILTIINNKDNNLNSALTNIELTLPQELTDKLKEEYTFIKDNPSVLDDLKINSNNGLKYIYSALNIHLGRIHSEIIFETNPLYNQNKTNNTWSNSNIVNTNGKTVQSSNNGISYYEGDIKPEPNTIFVFGSNPEGRHGAGAAKVAVDKFGAQNGVGEGLQGNAYALPTKRIKNVTPTKVGQMTFSYGDNKRSDVSSETTFEAIVNGERTATTRYESDNNIEYWKELKVGDVVGFKSAGNKDIVYVRITKPLTKLDSSVSAEEWSKKEGWSVEYFNTKVKPKIEKGQAYQMEYEFVDANGERTITPLQIIENIKKLYETARQNPDKQFKVAYRNTTEKSLNGYTGLEMIGMFIEAGSIPSNIVFSKEWVDTGLFDNSINKHSWARTAENNYEVSSQGDDRFSALNATFKEGTVIDGIDVGGMTIEDVYKTTFGELKEKSKDDNSSTKDVVFTYALPNSDKMLEGKQMSISDIDNIIDTIEENKKQTILKDILISLFGQNKDLKNELINNTPNTFSMFENSKYFEDIKNVLKDVADLFAKTELDDNSEVSVDNLTDEQITILYEKYREELSKNNELLYQLYNERSDYLSKVFSEENYKAILDLDSDALLTKESINNSNLNKEGKSYLNYILSVSNGNYYKTWNDFKKTFGKSYKEHREIKELDTALEDKLIELLNKLGFTVKESDREYLQEKYGLNINGVFNMASKLVEVVSSDERNITTLPEEAMHAFVEVSNWSDYKNNTEMYNLYKAVVNWEEYRNIYRRYKKLYTRNGVVDVTRIKKEALGQALAYALTNQKEFLEVREKYQNSKNIFGKIKYAFLKAVKSLYSLFTKSKKTINGDLEFKMLANKIADKIKNGDINDLIIENTKEGVLLNYENTLNNQSKSDGGFAKKMLQKISELGGVMTGSLALRYQNKIFRKSEDDLHDIDFYLDLNNYPSLKGIQLTREFFEHTDFFKNFKKEFKNVTFIKNYGSFKHDGQTFNYIVSKDKGFSDYLNFIIENLKENKKILTLDNIMEQIPESMRKNYYWLDIFLGSDIDYISDEKNGIKLVNYDKNLYEKMRLGRDKDINDYYNLNPSDEFVKYSVFYQINDSSDNSSEYVKETIAYKRELLRKLYNELQSSKPTKSGNNLLDNLHLSEPSGLLSGEDMSAKTKSINKINELKDVVKLVKEQDGTSYYTRIGDNGETIRYNRVSNFINNKRTQEYAYGNEKYYINNITNKVFYYDSSNEQYVEITNDEKYSNIVDSLYAHHYSNKSANEQIIVNQNGFNYIKLPNGKVLQYNNTTKNILSEQEAKGISFDGMTLLETAAGIGNKVDSFIREFFSKDGVTKETENDLFQGDNIFQKEGFIKQLEDVKTNLENRGLTIISDEITWYSDKIKENVGYGKMGIAGTTDLIAVDNKGIVHIYDIKTMTESGYKNFENTHYGLSKSDQYSKQISMYKLMIEETTGLKVGNIAVLPVIVKYNVGDTTPKSIRIEKGKALDDLSVMNINGVNVIFSRTEIANNFKDNSEVTHMLKNNEPTLEIIKRIVEKCK